MALAQAAEWLAASPLGVWATETALAYPVANVAHVLGLVLLLGGIGLVDLRLLGAFRSLPLIPVYRALVPVAAAGLAVMATSGLVMFAGDAEGMAASRTFRLKLLLIAAALLNIALFRLLIGRLPAEPVTALTRLLAAASLLLWSAAAVAGRWIAYS